MMSFLFSTVARPVVLSRCVKCQNTTLEALTKSAPSCRQHSNLDHFGGDLLVVVLEKVLANRLTYL